MTDLLRNLDYENMDIMKEGKQQMDEKMLIMPGDYHERKIEKCQDHGAIIHDKGVSTIVLCDGCSSSEYGGAAAKILATEFAQFMNDNFLKNLLFDPNEVRRCAAAFIHRILIDYADKNEIQYNELATTIMAVSENEDGLIVCFHLGDGRIFWRENEQEYYSAFSVPPKCAKGKSPGLTMNSDLLKRMRFIRWTKADGVKQILMATDGFDEYTGEEIQAYSDTGKTSRFIKYPFDDFSCAMIK